MMTGLMIDSYSYNSYMCSCVQKQIGCDTYMYMNLYKIRIQNFCVASYIDLMYVVT